MANKKLSILLVPMALGLCACSETSGTPVPTFTSAVNSEYVSPSATVQRPSGSLTVKKTTVAPKPSLKPSTPTPVVRYKSCKDVEAAGKAPIYRGQPGYSTKLDRDGDGVACDQAS